MDAFSSWLSTVFYVILFAVMAALLVVGVKGVLRPRST